MIKCVIMIERSMSRRLKTYYQVIGEFQVDMVIIYISDKSRRLVICNIN